MRNPRMPVGMGHAHREGLEDLLVKHRKLIYEQDVHRGQSLYSRVLRLGQVQVRFEVTAQVEQVVDSGCPNIRT